MSLAPSPSPAAVAPGATPVPERISFREFWAHYLLHHQHPMTRRLHFLGSAVCLAGFALSALDRTPWMAIAAVAIGYLCAFGGHWWVERNAPMTFRAPLRAGLCNWRLFGVECLALVGVGGGFESALASAVKQAPHVLAWMQSSANQ